MKMNLKGLFTAAVATGLAFTSMPSVVSADEGCSTIAEIACGLDDFSTLCAAVVAAGLADTLSGGTFTVFAPTNDAFAALPDGTVEFLVSDEGIPTLTDILLYHVIGGQKVKKSDLMAMGLTEMANGQDTRTIQCHVPEGELLLQKGAGNARTPGTKQTCDDPNLPDWPAIVAFDIEACNGIIHVVDDVILP